MNSDPIYKQIGTIVRVRRKALKMTQKDLAKKLAISRGSLANIEAGRQNILVHQLYRYAEALKLERFDLLPERLPDSSASATWKGLPLPPGLKSEQKEQIARLIDEASTETLRGKKSHG